MIPGKFISTYLVAFATFLVLDFAWLGLVARGFYRDQFGELLRPDVRWGAAIGFYMLYVAAILVLAVAPAVERGLLSRAVLLGGFFGLVAYATYDLTNLATLRGFPAGVVVVDMAWGTVLTATVSAVAFLFATRGA